MCDPKLFSSIKQGVSYCLPSQRPTEWAGQQKRRPLSKQRNHLLQSVLIEASKIAPRLNPKLAEVHKRASERGHKNRATVAVARKLVAYLLAADRAFFATQAELKPATWGLRFRGMQSYLSEGSNDFLMPVKRRRALVATNPPRNTRPDSSE